MRASGDDASDPIANDELFGPAPQHATAQPPVPGDRRLVVSPQRQIRHDRKGADATVEERLFREQEHAVALHFRPSATIRLTVDRDRAADRLALPGQHFDELFLPVARNTGDAQNLAFANRE